MSYFEVKDSLCRLVDLTQSESVVADSLCRESFKEIVAGLKADADTEDARVTAAAAGLAYYKLMLKRSGAAASDEVTSFKAGDVSISQGKKDISVQLGRAENYFRQCLAKIAHLYEDNGFAFTNVRVKVIP